MTLLNYVVLTGKVVTSPRLHYRPDGSPVVQFPLELNDSEEAREASSSRGKTLKRMGVKEGARGRVKIVAIGKLVEMKKDLLQSGQHLMVIGKLHQRHWQTPDGRNRTSTEVIAKDFHQMEEDLKNTIE